MTRVRVPSLLLISRRCPSSGRITHPLSGSMLTMRLLPRGPSSFRSQCLLPLVNKRVVRSALHPTLCGLTRRFSAAAVDADALRAGNRRALSKAITLTESTLLSHHQARAALLSSLTAPSAAAAADASSGSDSAATTARAAEGKEKKKSWRVGICGPPGVGKSTFIESFGRYVLNEHPDLSMAVLSIDPSSSRTGGSLLGDKTRMEFLSKHQRVYIRPSPAGSTLGGLAHATAEAVLLCEAAGYDIVIIETVGIGQSEVTISQVADCTVLLLNPAGGDDLQGLKKGIMEVCDMVCINKADGDLLPAARRTKVDYMHALQLMRPKIPVWKIPIMMVSSKPMERADGSVVNFMDSKAQHEHHASMGAVFSKMSEFFVTASGQRAEGEEGLFPRTNYIQQARIRNLERWMWSHVDEMLMAQVKHMCKPGQPLRPLLADLVAKFQGESLAPLVGADRLIAAFHDVNNSKKQ